MKLSDINLHDVGNTIQLAGAIYADGTDIYLVPLPGALTEDQHEGLLRRLMGDDLHPILVLDMDHDDWKTFIRQTDLLETEILTHAEGTGNQKLVKAVIRKSGRQISQGVSWKVYRRDNFKCRYCGIDDVPMTVDHLVLWEEGGPSIEENLVTACRKCNKTRGNMQYEEWLNSPFYKKMAKRLDWPTRSANQALVSTLASIPRLVHKPKTR